ncbi:MAG TPA: hypothetical protein VNR59_13490 [Gaiellaceae bacterium]|nr:hypothetical protein [Gaiellaceae bacterium]
MTSVTHEAAPARVRALAWTPAYVFAATFALGLAFSVKLLDPWEGWFLQVVSRVRAGEVLYRDVAYGAGPLPAYLAEGTTYLTSVDIIAVKLVVVAAFAGSATLAWLVAGELGIGLRGRLVVLAALAYVAPPLQQPPYAPLATTFLLGALLAALRPGRTAALAGGASCALAFCSKQNVGVYALAALVLSAVVLRRALAAGWAAGTFAVVTGALLLPVAVTGGLSRYVDYGFTGKGAYLHAPDPFASTLSGVVHTVTHVSSLAELDAAYWALGFFLPALAAVSLLLLRPTRETAVVVAFAAAGAATLYPRFDTAHVAYAAPPLVLLVAHSARTKVPRALVVVASLWVGIAVVLTASLPMRLARSPNAVLSDLPHMRGTFVDRGRQDLWRRENAAVLALGRPLLLLVPDAGFRYLMTGLRNPTAFDFPFVTTFGKTGQERVVRALASREITRVCVAGEWFGLEPTRIVNYVRTTMRPTRRLGFCRLYTAHP